MASLAEDLSAPKHSLNEFLEVCTRTLEYMPNVITDIIPVRDNYTIHISNIQGQTKYVRPIRSSIFIDDPDRFQESYRRLKGILGLIKNGKRNFSRDDRNVIDMTLYTTQQAIGAGLDLMINPNSARKHVGNRFEELIRLVITEIGVPNKKLTFQIPFESETGQKLYKCETDLIISPYQEVKSTTNELIENEIVLSFKTTSKDRMGKIFLDKLLMERFSGHPVRVLGIFLNDVQRKGHDNISYTLVSNLFMVYTKFLARLDGVYFIDRPSKAYSDPFDKHIFAFSKFITEDIWSLVSDN